VKLFLVALWMAPLASWAQTPATTPYTLLSGSKLIEECLICGLPPTVVPLTGTFNLQWLSQTPVTTRYGLQNIFFHAGDTSGPQYEVTGSGVYQVGGEVAVMQELFLNTEISNLQSTVSALCVSTNGPVVQPWPKIQIQVDQTNGTAAQVFHLILVAVPVPQLFSIFPDVKSGDVQLDWAANGETVQVERAPDVLGPYSAVSPVTTNSFFNDVGALTNSSRFFYRLHPF
jgi:hypothetical protein